MAALAWKGATAEWGASGSRSSSGYPVALDRPRAASAVTLDAPGAPLEINA